MIAVGSDFRGLTVSAAASPMSSVPANDADDVTRTLQNPLKPLLKGPGSRQYVPPIYPLVGSPPMLITVASRLVMSVQELLVQSKPGISKPSLHKTDNGHNLDNGK